MALVWSRCILVIVLSVAFAAEIDVSLSGEAIAAEAPAARDNALQVSLRNSLARPVDVYWIENAGREVLVVPNLAAGAATPMNTFAGHGFFFAEQGKVRCEHFFRLSVSSLLKKHLTPPTRAFPSLWGLSQGRDAILQTVVMQPGTFVYAVSEAGLAASPYVAAATGDGAKGGACVDRKPYCALSAARNECAANPGWMIVNCARSCGMCELLDPAKRCDRERLNIRWVCCVLNLIL